MSKKKLSINNKAPIALVYRPDTTAAVNMAKTLTKWLLERKHKVFTAPEQKNYFWHQTTAIKTADRKNGFNHCSWRRWNLFAGYSIARGKPIPILGINMGRWGF